MDEPTIYSNLIKLKGLEEVQWCCYSQIITMGELYHKDARDSSIFVTYNELLNKQVPCFVSLESYNGDQALLILFVFYFSEGRRVKVTNEDLKEVKSGIITNEMLQKTSAADLYPDKSQLFSINISNEIHPKFNQSSTIPLKLNEFNEMELLIFAIKNLFSNEIKKKGAIQLGRSFITPIKKVAQIQGTNVTEQIKYKCIDIDPWYMNSSFYFKPISRDINIKNISFCKSINNGDKVLLSPHGTEGIFLTFSKIKEQEENQLLNLWAHKTSIPIDILDSNYYNEHLSSQTGGVNSNKFCIILISKFNIRLHYPCSLVFIVNDINKFEEDEASSQHSIKELLDSLVSNAPSNNLNTTTEPVTPQKIKGNEDNVSKKESVLESMFDRVSITDVDKWLDSLSLTTKETPPNLQNKNGLIDTIQSTHFDTVSPSNPVPSLISGNIAGTDPTPPTDYEVPIGHDMLNNSLGFLPDPLEDFCMDEFDNFGNFEITDTDFSYFDKNDSKNNSAHSIHPTLEHENLKATINGGNIMEKGESNQYLFSNGNEPHTILNGITNDNLSNLNGKYFNNDNLNMKNESNTPTESTLHEKLRNPNLHVILTSSDPWLSINYKPLKNFIVNRGFLEGGKYSKFSKELTKALKKMPSKPFKTLKYRPYYVPASLKEKEDTDEGTLLKRSGKKKRMDHSWLKQMPSKISRLNGYKGYQLTVSKDIKSTASASNSNYECSSESSCIPDSPQTGLEGKRANTKDKVKENDYLNEVVLSPNFSFVWLRVNSSHNCKIHPPNLLINDNINASQSNTEIGTNNISIWEDVDTLRIFMDQLRTYYYYPDDIHSINFHQLHASCYNTEPSEVSLCWKDVLKSLQCLTTIFKINQPSLINSKLKNKFHISGPLSIKDFHKALSDSYLYKLQTNSQIPQTLDPKMNPFAYISGPKIQAYNVYNTPIELGISSASFWKTLSLQPIHGIKDLTALIVFPQQSFTTKQTSSFFDQLFQTYKN
ncbi:hypothetical protein K502DRAFT_224406 [Neoconidiobolus thromboides FSU 785]|nr:hypothetical protein K502DRAFT_224406 [Neoconidiobolus thromboides FSU 785]